MRKCRIGLENWSLQAQVDLWKNMLNYVLYYVIIHCFIQKYKKHAVYQKHTI